MRQRPSFSQLCLPFCLHLEKFMDLNLVRLSAVYHEANNELKGYCSLLMQKYMLIVDKRVYY